jgi:hypothetical protein
VVCTGGFVVGAAVGDGPIELFVAGLVFVEWLFVEWLFVGFVAEGCVGDGFVDAGPGSVGAEPSGAVVGGGVPPTVSGVVARRAAAVAGGATRANPEISANNAVVASPPTMTRLIAAGCVRRRRLTRGAGCFRAGARWDGRGLVVIGAPRFVVVAAVVLVMRSRRGRQAVRTRGRGCGG